MREILFRGKRLDNGEWVEGTIIDYYPNMAYMKTKVVNVLGREMLDYVEVIPETVGQFTGLIDKSGKKIFEGDIVDASSEWWDACGPAGHDSPILPVEWDDYFCGFTPFANYDCDCGVYIEASNCTVIGNIHNNAELLEE